MEVRINLNEFVKFKLSERGKEVYRHRYDGYEFEYNREPELDDDGYMSMQLWQFMQIFGEHMIMGMPEVLKPLEIIKLENETYRPSGMWIDKQGNQLKIGGYSGYCSRCHEWSEYLTDYCGNCGAYMVKENE